MTNATTGHAPADLLVPDAVDAALRTLRRNIAAFGAVYPDDTTAEGRYLPRSPRGGLAEGGNSGWTTGFWPGMLWLAWELSEDDTFLTAAREHAVDFDRRVRADEDLDHHDLGFLYTLACVSAWRLTGDEAARAAALAAADRLMRRFLEPAGIVQAWGDLSDPAQRGRTIIDSLMNMPLLTWAHEQTGEERFAEAVRRHSEQLRRHILRDDDSTFHTFYWDAETGEPLRGGTEQGAADGSCWARGQAWGIYGFALNHRAVGDPALLEASRRCADYFLAHLPADGVAHWDLVFGEGSGAERDSSAAAIAVCGLAELAAQLDDDAAATRYREAADRILASLIAGYAPGDGTSDALLLHGVYDLPKGNGVDEGNLWGDYFYLEALTRATKPDWAPYW
ncbi:MAG: glycoside hydrolase family 88 protein [Tessaracoccus sp.]|uniref:glycoside hydrolase family 88 protein n=1 Tax=Tessaracoccus sp. TaxID=1971211 RepID=UPI001ED15AB2|nr:glycoside hydrolase family 88 protein [Tessaracoccus sp.]MBK7819970.1 glycoside hydrolase family 88 protein [Tessaracoccus sp.]